jgi:hypothetical protein
VRFVEKMDLEDLLLPLFVEKMDLTETYSGVVVQKPK